MIFRASRFKLFISATLPKKEIFCRSLGLQESETIYIETPNVFPIENRKIYYISDKDDRYKALTNKKLQSIRT